MVIVLSLVGVVFLFGLLLLSVRAACSSHPCGVLCGAVAFSLSAVALGSFLRRYESFGYLSLLVLTLFLLSGPPQSRAEVWFRGVSASYFGGVSGLFGKRNYLEGRLQFGE